MNANYNNDIRVIKLKQMILSRFGKALEFQAVTPMAVADDSHKARVRGHDYVIPLFVNHAYLGTAVVPGADDLSTESQMQISQAVRLIMEPLMYRDYLTRVEENLRSSAGAPGKNVLRLASFEDEETEEIESPLTSQIVHFYGKTDVQKQKAANQLHDLSAHWAQIDFRSINKDGFSVADLRDLGMVTLLVTDLESLTDIKWIEDYARLPKREQNLLLVLGSVKSADELLKESRLSRGFHQTILPFSLNTDRAPVNEFRLKQVLLHLYMS